MFYTYKDMILEKKNNNLMNKIQDIIVMLLPFLVLVQFRPRIIIDLTEYYPTYPISYLNAAWQILQIMSFVLIFVIFIWNLNFDKLLITYLLALIGLIISTVINGTPFTRLISLLIAPVSILIALNVSKEKNIFDRGVKWVYLYHAILIIINFILVLVFPNSLIIDNRGMGVYYLFGNYQQNTNWFVVFIATSAYVTDKNIIKSFNSRYLNIIVTILMFLTSYLVWSVTAMLSLSVVYLLIGLFTWREKLIRIFNPILSFILGLFSTIFIGVFEGLKYFSFIIEDIFHKNITMGSRMLFWERAIDYFLEKPIFGQGFEASAISFEKIGRTTSHNHYINLLYNGGIVYFILILVIVYIITKEISLNIKKRYVGFASAAITGYFVYFLTEARLNMNVFIFLMGFIFYALSIEKQAHNNRIILK